MKNFNHYNNPKKSGYYNAMLCMHPKDTAKLPFEIIDITCQDWEKVKTRYHSFCQGMRMISCEGEGMEFSKRPDQSCSMILTATDTSGNLYIVFTRSPYTHLEMIIAALLQAFGWSVGSCGLANVLQCGRGSFFFFFFIAGGKKKQNKFNRFASTYQRA